MLNTLETLVAENRLPDALAQLLALLEGLPERFRNRISILEGRLAANEDMYTQRGLPDEGYIQENDRIRYAFLELLREIREELNRHFSIANLAGDTSRDRKNLKNFLQSFFKGRYKITGSLKEGVNLINLLGRDAATGREVMIKVLKIDMLQDINEGLNKSTLEVVKNEIKKVTPLKHRNIIKIQDVYVEDYPYCIITEYVWGITLHDLLDRVGVIPFPLAVKIMIELCDVLDYMRQRRIYQTRFRPDNIILDEESKPMISPFEVIQANSGLRKVKKFREDCQYFAPELMEGTLDPDQEPDTLVEAEYSDQFTLGLIAFEMLTGEPFFGKGSIPGIILRRNEFFSNKTVQAEKYAKLEKYPLRFVKLIRKLLQYDPNQRYPGLGDVAEELSNFKTDLSPRQKVVLQSYCRCLAMEPDFTKRFYEQFFEAFPEVRHRFSDNMENQHKMLQTTQRAFLESGSYEAFLERLPKMRGHENVRFEQYAQFINIFMKLLEKTDPKWEIVKDDWIAHREDLLPQLKKILEQTKPN